MVGISRRCIRMLLLRAACAAALICGTALAYGSAGCETWCSAPCTALIGDTSEECAECPATSGCHPGALGFGVLPTRSASRDDPAADAYAPPPPPKDDTAEAMAYLRGKVSARPATVTAGGEEVGCMAKRISKEQLLLLTREERAALLLGEPTIVTGLIDDWPAHASWADPAAFVERFGHHEVFAKRVTRGWIRVNDLFGSDTEEGRAIIEDATLSLAEVAPHAGLSDQMVIMDLQDMSAGEAALLEDLSRDYEVPPLLEAVSNARLFSYGGAKGVQMSVHDAAWLGVVSGAKLWHLAPPGSPKPGDRECRNSGKIDWALAKRENVRHCIQLPGEVMVFGDGWWHATCNLQPYTVAMGAQTWESGGKDVASNPTYFAMDEKSRPFAGETRPLNAFQSRVVKQGLQRGMPLPSSAAAGAGARRLRLRDDELREEEADDERDDEDEL